MSQHINLLDPELLPKYEWLGARLMLFIVISALLGVLGFYAWTTQQNQALAAQQKLLQTQLETTKQQLAQAAAQRSTRPPAPELIEQVKRAERNVQYQQRVLAFLQTSNLEHSQGFSRYLRAFAKRSTAGLWLTRFQVEGDAIEISGKALTPPLVADYVSNLNQEAIFKGRQFASLETRNIGDGKNAGQSEFKLKAALATEKTSAATKIPTSASSEVYRK